MINPSEINPTTLPSVTLQNKGGLPNEAGIYFAIDSIGTVQYIGQSSDIRARWKSHRQTKKIRGDKGCRIAYILCPESLLNNVEEALITWFLPPLNTEFRPHVRSSSQNTSIKNRLASWLEESGDTYQQAADKVGVHYTTISRIANNKLDRLELSTIEAICEVYKKKVQEFLYKEGESDG